MLRIAALSDIHGNFPAFEAALEHVAQQNVDRIVIVGDIAVGAPDSVACWRLACESGGVIVKGNGDDYIARFGTPAANPNWTTEERYGPIRWAAQQFSEEERRAIDALPMTHKFPDLPNLLFFHASPNGFDGIKAYTPDGKMQELLGDVTERYLVRGHQHNPQVRLWEDHIIVNCGSVGMPVDQSLAAQYLLLDQYRDGWHLRHQFVDYDVDTTLRRFHDTGYLETVGPLARLEMRHIATGTTQVSVFVRYYKKWVTESDISLSDAVDRFLNLY